MLKRMVVTVLPISILLGITFSYLYYQESQKRQILIETTEEVGHIQLQLRTISENFKDIVSDLLFLSEQHELKALLDGEKDFSAEGLANDYLSFSLRSGLYDQIRFIDTEGMEMVRVNYNNGRPLFVSKENLQDKSNRYYFKNSTTLKRGEIYVSPLDLNIENGKIEQPIKPMIRFATPVFDSNGKKRGVIAINFLGSVLISHLRDASRTALGKVSLTNKEGYWLFGQDLESEWGFMFKDKKDVRFSNMYPKAWKRISREESGQFYTTEGLFTFGTIRPLLEVENAVTALISTSRTLSDIRDKDEYVWKTVSMISPDTIESSRRSLARRYFFLFIATTFVATVLVRLYFRVSYYRDIAEGIIDERAEVFKALSEAASEGVVLVDGFTIRDCNSRLVDMLGYEKNEIIGKKVWDLVVPDFHEIIKARIATGEDNNFEGVAIKKDGTKFPFEAHGKAFTYKGHSARIGAIRDISDRKKTEQEMRLHSQIISSMAEGVHLINTKGVILYTNRRFDEMFGYDLGELSGKHISILNAPTKQSPEETASKIIKTLEDKGSWNGEVENIKKDGTCFWTYTSVASFKHSEYGTVWLTVKTNITERKKAEEALKLMALFAEMNPAPVLRCDREGNLQVANPMAKELLKIEKVEGTVVPKVLPEVDFALIKSCIEDSSVSVVISRIDRKDYQFAICGSKDAGVANIYASDITHLKETEETLIKAKEEAEEATRIKDKFVSLVSHDLRSPMGTIMGFLKLLRKDDRFSSSPDIIEMIDATVDSGENMVKLIEDVLSASRLKTGKMIPILNFVDLYGLTLKAMVNSEPSAKQKGIELINDVPGNSRVYVDTTLMYEVLQNLVSNAVKFCAKGDSIRLFIPKGERTTLAVSDTGKGISPGNLENLFSYEIKTTTPGTMGEKGTGLGLPLANDIVKAHGGTLEVESVVGKGSEFRVKIPYARPMLLLVDDDKFARDMYRLVLKNLDVAVVDAENGVMALEEIGKMKPDLVITDINMPEMGGFELIKNIRKDPALDSIPIIALTSDDSIETRDRCFRLGANDFSSKEVSAADFIPRVRRFIG